MTQNEQPKLILLEELLTEFEQQLDIDEEREEEVYAQYSWEKGMEILSWEQLIDKDGVLQFIQPKTKSICEKGYVHATQDVGRKNVIEKRGIIRYVILFNSHNCSNLVIIFDISDRMRETDFKPDRCYCAFAVLKKFIKELFHQGPITQLAIVGLRDKESILISPLGSNPNEQIERLGSVIKEGARGVASLQNGFEMCLTILEDLPCYTTREVLVIFGSTRTFDVGNILVTLKRLINSHITVSAISLSPEIYILKHICDETQGRYFVAMDSTHLRTLFNDFTIPPKWKPWMEPMLTKVGFPPFEKASTASLCACHSKLTYQAYICPQCHSKFCSIPIKCKCCGLYLVSPPDIARTFHHLIHPKVFIQESTTNICFSCNYSTNNGARCPDCQCFFCEYCNQYIHKELHQCPFCMIKIPIKSQQEPNI
ncbi:bifunctional von Willebrand factor A-like domain superfamily/TFIIH subunit Ssl1-p44/TFIIH C1-like domain/Zinc finger [Babesia duncani]|uniref:Bifunctional von Willebrand factor A-like domain superfamily/TFIIH subunit Ssl1-p44/TFIIH C1-like domain/Zinc finger n=1 Tax=Babesia duncani TaxID=323732 RepID=A0AAD9PKK8_9APIC|nr:bifunctional von Willebrand factor A-like domain superfamily/TFIIH subunit Ssl1-p44/TFIIH C1-like domain/Zinc finger [Babesia duncani]